MKYDMILIETLNNLDYFSKITSQMRINFNSKLIAIPQNV